LKPLKSDNFIINRVNLNEKERDQPYIWYPVVVGCWEGEEKQEGAEKKKEKKQKGMKEGKKRKMLIEEISLPARPNYFYDTYTRRVYSSASSG
jgi:hypothetical protein